VDALNWRWVFGINVVPVAVTLYLTTKLTTGQDGTRPQGPIDVVGALLGAVGLSATVYALIEQQQLGFTHPAVLSALAVGLGCLGAFPWWEAQARSPMMPLSLFGARNFAVGNVVTVFFYAAISIGILLVSLFLQEAVGMGATSAGLATLPIPVLSFLLAKQFGSLAGRHGPRLYMAVGPVVAAAGFLWMTTVHEPFELWTQLLPGLVVFGLGLTITVSPLTAAVLAAVTPEQSGIGSAVNNAVSRIAGLIAVACVSVILGQGLGGDGMSSSTVDFAGFRQGSFVVAGLFLIAGVCAAIGIDNATHDGRRVSVDATARCQDRAAPPPAVTPLRQ
jgi:MFS family permease